MKYPDGSLYQGNWKDGMQDGEGFYIEHRIVKADIDDEEN